MTATTAQAGYRAGFPPARRVRHMAQDFGTLEWGFAATVLQTVLFNPVLGSAGPLAVYLSALTWPLLFAAALVRLLTSRDAALRRAGTALLVSNALICSLIAVQLGILDLQTYSISTLAKLAYLPAGIVAAICVYRSADRMLDLVVVALGIKSALVLVTAVQGPIDLLHRVGPRSLGGPNTFGMLLALVVVLRLSTWILAGKRPGPFVLGAMPLCVIAMSLTFTRSALLAFVFGLVLLLVISIGRRGIRAGLIAGAVAVALSALLLLQAPVRDRVTSLTEGSSSGRDAIVDSAWRGINEAPFIGHGFGSFQFRSPYIVEFSGAGSNTTPSAHNIFLQILYEGGLVGLLAIALATWVIVRPVWSVVLAPAFLMLAVDGLFETFAYVIQTSWVIGVLMAVGLHYRTREPKPAWAAVRRPRAGGPSPATRPPSLRSSRQRSGAPLGGPL
jgi:O-antigen ligase